MSTVENELATENVDLNDPETSQSVNAGPRILGGRRAIPGQFPYQAELTYEGRHKCGGAIIDEFHVLTAAHCIAGCTEQTNMTFERSKDDLRVIVGEHSLRNQNQGEQCHEIETIFVHEEHPIRCPKIVRDYDIALIRTKRPINFQISRYGYGSVSSISLPYGSYDENPSTAIASGWGKAEYGFVEDVLRWAQLPVLSRSRCALILKNQILLNVEAIVCAGDMNVHSGAGDSGGPLAQYDGREMKLIGITSGSIVFTKVSYYLDWIDLKRSLYPGGSLEEL